jgi:hypothetical protein
MSGIKVRNNGFLLDGIEANDLLEFLIVLKKGFVRMDPAKRTVVLLTASNNDTLADTSSRCEEVLPLLQWHES